MLQDLLLPIFVIAGVPKANRIGLFEQLLPMTLPVSNSQRLAIAVFGAEQQIKRQALTEQSLVEEAIRAGGINTPASLAKYPALDAAFRRLPLEVQSSIFKSAGSPTDVVQAQQPSRVNERSRKPRP